MTMKRTPLFELHQSLGARMVPFAGWEMPVQYSSIIEEHKAVRENAGIFDVSHMGEIIVSGEGALRFLDMVTCNRVASIEDGQVQYNAVVNEDGGLVDDITIYRLSSTEFFVCSNASNYEAVEAHFRKYKPNDVTVINESEDWHQIALQGPNAESLLKKVTGVDPSEIYYFRFKDYESDDHLLRISRTGYTGEDGFEIYSDVAAGVKLWEELLATNAVVPVGLGARDTLRLEAMYPLYGHELNATLTPVESGIGWIVKDKDEPYLGYERIMEHKKNGPPGRVVPLVLEEAGVPRDDYPVLDAGGAKELGRILSGTHSPSLGKGIGTAYLPAEAANEGTELLVEIRKRRPRARVVKGPFVQGTAGRNRFKKG